MMCQRYCHILLLHEVLGELLEVLPAIRDPILVELQKHKELALLVAGDINCDTHQQGDTPDGMAWLATAADCDMRPEARRKFCSSV